MADPQVERLRFIAGQVHPSDELLRLVLMEGASELASGNKTTLLKAIVALAEAMFEGHKQRLAGSPDRVPDVWERLAVDRALLDLHRRIDIAIDVAGLTVTQRAAFATALTEEVQHG